jgi:hypothetical protein
MIGFTRELRSEEPQTDEGPETVHLEKKELYEMVDKDWFVPPYFSRGVTRDYLLKVHKNRVFRIGHSELKHFEVDLTPAHQRKVQGMGHSVLVRKLNALLSLTSRKPLGFTEHDVPDQTWLHRVARVIDPTSLTEFFEIAVRKEPQPNSDSIDISLIYHGRMAAAKWFMRHNTVKSNRRFWEALTNISGMFRGFLNKSLTIETLEKELAEQLQEKQVLANNLDDLISKAALTYCAILNPTLKPEAVIGGTADITAEMRSELHRTSRL